MICMADKRPRSKIAASIDKSDRKQRLAKEKEGEQKKTSRRHLSPGVHPIGDDFSSQNVEAEEEVEKVSKGPNQ